jgi:hypothetical protein
MANLMQFSAIGATAIALLIELFLHRYQRATLAIANLQTGGKGSRQEIAGLQMAMMPDWVGPVGLLGNLATGLAAVLLYFAFSWWGVIGIALVYMLGPAIGGIYIPIMPYAWCLASIEEHLKSSQLKLMTGQRLPIGAMTDLSESLQLSTLVHDLVMDSANGKRNVEAIAAGRIA